MPRQVCYDVTHLVSRLGITTPSGFDKVDLAYGRHFTGSGEGPFVHYGLLAPHSLSAERARRIVELAGSVHWQQAREGEADPAFDAVRNRLLGRDIARDGTHALRAKTLKPKRPVALQKVALQKVALQADLEATRLRLRLGNDRTPIPDGAIYLNVAQHLFEHHFVFRWLKQRPDVRPVFMIHDLLNIDYPEFFAAKEEAQFCRRMDLALEHGRAFIVTTEAVRQRLADEIARRGKPAVPIMVAPLPSSLELPVGTETADTELSAVPYFVTVGTIEPRKNHLLLLNVWRQLAEAAATGERPLPKLVVIGGRGWENEQVLDILDRGRFTRPYVIEASGLSSIGLSRLVANARALLMPSFAEGYGLPLVEALSLGTPVIATDAPVFREVTQRLAIYRNAIDGLGWHEAILSLADLDGPASRDARAAARRFKAPKWDGYFETVESFLASL